LLNKTIETRKDGKKITVYHLPLKNNKRFGLENLEICECVDHIIVTSLKCKKEIQDSLIEAGIPELANKVYISNVGEK